MFINDMINEFKIGFIEGYNEEEGRASNALATKSLVESLVGPIESFRGSHDDLYIWADDTICYDDDLEEFLTFMSDDYIRVPEDSLAYPSVQYFIEQGNADCIYDEVCKMKPQDLEG